ncbi:T9SS type A sorting domain-containing protein [Kaistella jeonii]|uniref:Secretion system C-terminal sorting domain-containing protein n=1 Tax=Kaistella jeonii TaxID=266749 RepID=A0A0C1FJX8_9FLAO|nr:T9SS type A sorting domain-containing protein [Kaistella jeonii]KIA88234.1 hypothetical protein OA86_12000 [Kaistella jeonii]SFC26566.1 Por secretion system C-terminal sorting domain-containing protein [Kaistella jeonii]VEI95702.1 Por secretion system C-terminal sorting domain [Kaistella jeonii]
MKRKIILLAIFATTTGFFNAQVEKLPNQLPTNALVKQIAKPAFLATFPTTNWSDFADTSWYNATDVNFEISSAEQLAGLAKLVKAGNKMIGKNFKVMQNMDLSAHLWDPIGYNNNNPFSGNVDGNFKTISNLQINRTGGDWLGLFGQFITATVKNLTLDGSQIYGSDTSGGFIGNMAVNSKADNCHVKNLDLVFTSYNVGGFTGGVLTGSEVTNCSAKGSVVGVNQIGGFAGTSWSNSLISKSFCEGTVQGQYIIGGFSGFVTFAFGPPTVNRIEDSYSRSNVTALSEQVGGFYGSAQSTGNFKNVYSTGTVNLLATTGGFVGTVGNLTIQNAHYDYTNAPYDAVGEFMGAPATLDITSHATADMKTDAFKTTMNAGNATGIWSIDPAINDGYPYLNTQPLLAVNNVKSNAVDVQITPTQADSTLRIITTEVKVSYEIVDFSGKLSRSGNVSGTQKEVNVSSLVKGIYIINVKTEKGSKSIKFIKK